ncbi:cytochrome c oxidase subunit VB-domain-containing protein [Lipomyces arxii]|uniref:cytochrome c oxidase subunit VB-domain-containing protein n=1 Tax=Lipomyces arxii TaxID=56418 RepID=UPI0034CDBEE1
MYAARQITRQAAVAGRRVVAAKSAVRLTFVATRFFSQTAFNAKAEVAPKTAPGVSTTLEEITSTEDLFGPGAEAGVVPTDFEQSTGLERLELLGNMAGIDVFDLKPLSPDRVGTMTDPIVIDVPVDQKYIGCTGIPADSHDIEWMSATIREPARCLECGSVFKLNYIGPPLEDHHH